MSNDEIRVRRDRDKHKGGLIKFVRKGFISKRLRKYDSLNIEAVFFEVTIPNKN